MKPLYTRLAAVGIRKNGRAYIPYILTAAVMIAVFYITAYLTYSSFLNGSPGGRTMSILLNVGVVVLAVFSLIFLFYTNSVLIKRRKKEFGLYNILGLGKLQIAQVLVWETLLTYALSMAFGLGLGILFSKLAEMLATKMLEGDQNLDFYVERRAVIMALLWFAIVFALILINSLRQLFFSRPIQLLRSENAGEKPPKTNIPFAVLGVILLGVAYTMAVVIKDLSAAIPAFCAAVILVIIATYLLFISGSVALCKILQKNKRYYYKTSHFVSISQMAYRMRQNGAGLASICILSTMVLVTLSSTTTLYSAAAEQIGKEFPSEFRIGMYLESADGFDKFDRAINDCLAKIGKVPENRRIVHEVVVKNSMLFNDMNSGISPDTYFTGSFYVASEHEELRDYAGALEERDIIITERNTEYFKDFKTLKFKDWTEFNVIYLPDAAIAEQEWTAMTDGSNVAVLGFFVKNTDVLDEIIQYQHRSGEYKGLGELHAFYYFDAGVSDAEQQKTRESITMALLSVVDHQIEWFEADSKVEEGGKIIGIYGGLFFLGVLLGGVFLLSAVLIMYYKQISEGYEDAARFAILRKVGMSKFEIRRAVNSGVLTVFFLPLVAAGVHLAFAFPLLTRMLRAFMFTNTLLFALVTLASYSAFAVIYILVYRATSKSYRKIVSN